MGPAQGLKVSSLITRLAEKLKIQLSLHITLSLFTPYPVNRHDFGNILYDLGEYSDVQILEYSVISVRCCDNF